MLNKRNNKMLSMIERTLSVTNLLEMVDAAQNTVLDVTSKAAR